jgi:hypothetical protein
VPPTSAVRAKWQRRMSILILNPRLNPKPEHNRG